MIWSRSRYSSGIRLIMTGWRLDRAKVLTALSSVIVLVWPCSGALPSASASGEDTQFTELCKNAAESVRSGKYSEAIRLYDAALHIHPDSPEVLNNLAVACYEAHQYSRALEISKKIWKSHPELRSAALICGLAAIQCDRPEDALEPLSRLLVSANQQDKDALLGLASAYIALGRISDAIDVYKRAVASFPNDAQAWYGLAISYERSAENASRKLAHMPGGRSYSKRLLADYLQSLGDSRLAAEAFGGAQEPSPVTSPDAEATYEQARSLAAESQKAFEHFVALASNSWQADVFLGDVERQHGRLSSALVFYEKAAQAAPDAAAPLLGLGTVHWELGQFEEAEKYLRRVLQLNPQSAQAIFELANIRVRQRRETEAIPLLERFLQQQPDALAARADLGRAYLHLNRYADAARELRKAAPSDEQGDIHYQLAIALRNLGRTAEAAEAMRDSTRIRNDRARREQALQQAK
jgi:tetratricopeptide (TPR) repeat protein